MATPLRERGRRRGFAVLFSLAILVLLSVFALSFVNLTRLERLAATNVRLQVQAAALAEAGVGQACAEARTAARLRPWIEGTDWWANGAFHPVIPACVRCNTVPPGPPAPAVPAPALTGPSATCAGCRLCLACDKVNAPAATSCSDCGQPVAPTVLDPRGIVLGKNAFGGLDQVQIRSFDVASKLDVNLRTPGLAGALSELGMSAGAITALITARDARGGVRSREELRAILGDTDYQTFRDFLTVYSTPRLHATVSRSGNLPWDYSSSPAPYSPVNINGASQQVLAAVMANIAGRPIEIVSDGPTNWLIAAFQGNLGRVTSGGTVTISPATARKVAAEIVACRRRINGPFSGNAYASQPTYGGPFRTWRQFELFLENQPGSVISAQEAALLLAAVHAESRTMGYNPDATRRHPGGVFDRASVTSFTTRFSLGGAGILEVRATGWLTDGRGISVGEAEVDRVVRVFTPLTWGTQAELEQLCTLNRSFYQSMPELVPWATSGPDPLDGHVRLTTEHQGVGGNAAYSSAFRTTTSPPTDPTGPFDLSVRSVDLTLAKKGIIAPDGVLTYRADRQADQSRLATSTDLPIQLSQAGSFELWVKNWGDASIGTDECLLTLSVDEAPRWTAALRTALEGCVSPFTQPNALGATVKLERFKDRLRVTWFYWGQGTGAISPFVLTLSEVQANVSAWKPGEWHHIMCSWTNTNQDWPAATTGDPLERADRPDDGIRMWVDGVEATLDIFKYSALEHQNINSVKYNLGKSVSTPMTEGVIVGGYNHDTVGILVHSTGTPSGSLRLQRYTNTTIDDVFVSTVAYSGGGSALPRNTNQNNARFFKNDSNEAITFNVPFGAYGEVGAVGIEAEVPNTACSATLEANGSTSKYDNPLAPKPAALDAEATSAVAVNGVLPIKVTLKGNGYTTPVLESITVNVLPPLQTLEEDRNLP